MAQRTGITKAAMIAAGPDGEPKPEADPAYKPPATAVIDGVNTEGVDVEGYVNPTVSRTKRKTQAVIIPEREDEEPDDSQFVYFVPPKHEAVSYSVEAVLDSKLARSLAHDPETVVVYRQGGRGRAMLSHRR